MTECRDDVMRDQLPDFDSGTLATEVQTQLRAHVAGCDACAEELALVRTVRSVRPVPTPVDVQAIVSRLPKPEAVLPCDSSVIPIHGGRRKEMLPSVESTPRRRRLLSNSTWQLAAALGLMVVGAGSVMIARSGKVDATFTVPNAVPDSLPPTVRVPELAERSDTVAIVADPSPTQTFPDASRTTVAISFGDVGDYTEEELDRILARLDQWDGATSTESMPAASIVPATAGKTLP